jgi:hypothetical protein
MKFKHFVVDKTCFAKSHTPWASPLGAIRLQADQKFCLFRGNQGDAPANLRIPASRLELQVLIRAAFPFLHVFHRYDSRLAIVTHVRRGVPLAALSSLGKDLFRHEHHLVAHDVIGSPRQLVRQCCMRNHEIGLSQLPVVGRMGGDVGKLCKLLIPSGTV